MLMHFSLLALVATSYLALVFGEKMLVEEYLQQHRQELAVITPAERDKQVTEWPAPRSPALRDIIYHVNKDDIEKERKNSRGKRQVSVHPDSCFLLVGNRRSLVQYQNVPTPRLHAVQSNFSNIVAVDFDKRDDYLFWSDVGLHRIYRSHGNGSATKILVETNITTPDGIAWDWVSKKLYWTDAGDHDLEVYDPSSGYRKLLFQFENTSLPRAIIVDPTTQLMYWTDWGTPAKILRSAMDGTAYTVLHNSDLRWPNCLTMDYDNQILYWMDAGFGHLESSNTDGSNREELSSLHIYHPFSMVFMQGTFYWSDWYLNAILATNQKELNNKVFIVLGDLVNDPMGLTASCMEKQNTTMVNPCDNKCRSLCLMATSPAHYSCKCADSTAVRGLEGCSQSCGANGACVGNRCECNDGWRGATCDRGVCNSPCIHGECTSPGVCTCDPGWKGDTCSTATCCESCGKGKCTSPDVCTCNEGYEGRFCDQRQCLVAEGCLNGGTCKGSVCDCPKGFHGERCQIGLPPLPPGGGILGG